MKGLVLKDIYTLGNYKKIYAAMLLVAIGINFFLKDSGSFIAVFPIVYLSTTLVGIFAYDETAKWDRYAITMPVNRKEVVLARYLVSLLVLLVILPISMGSGFLASLFSKNAEAIPALLASTLVGICMFLLIIAISFPASYKFGAEKGRYVMAFGFLGVFAVVMLVLRLGSNVEKVVNFIAGITTGQAIFAGILVVVACLALFVGSLFLSMGIYRKKEF